MLLQANGGSEMTRHIIKAGLVVRRGDSFLLLRKRGTRFWILPGGKPEPGEGTEQALVREVVEELGCQVRPESIRFLGEYSDVAANEPDTTVTIPLYIGDIDGVPVPKAEIDAMCWYPADDPNEQDLSPIVARKIIPALRGAGIIRPDVSE